MTFIDVGVTNRRVFFLSDYPEKSLLEYYSYTHPQWKYIERVRPGWDGLVSFLKDDEVPAGLFWATKKEIEEKLRINFRIKAKLEWPKWKTTNLLGSDRSFQNECRDAMIRASRFGGGLVINCTRCVDGDTYIDCPRDLKKYPYGIKIKDLVGKQPWLYSFSRKKQRVVLSKADWVRQTGEQVPVYRVWFQLRGQKNRWGGRKVEFLDYLDATAEHLLLMRERRGTLKTGAPHFYNGYEYKAVKDLVPGDRVMPLFRTYGEIGGGYACLNLNDGTKKIEHRFILDELEGEKDADKWHGHHRNENVLDNRVENLEWKQKSKHYSDHASKRNSEGGDFGWQNTTGVHPKGMLGKKQSKYHAERTKEWADRCWEEKCKTDEWRRKDVLEDLYCVKGLSSNKIAKIYGVQPYSILNALKRNKLNVENNHKVESVEFLGYRDVYDISVPKYHNFCANGIFVHNSGKTRIAAMLFSCLKGPVCFIVDQLVLMEQAKSDLQNDLKEEIGWVGDSDFEPRRVTVATRQTMFLHQNRREFKDWTKKLEVIVIDEIHAQMNKSNFSVIEQIQPKAVFGLTATLQLNKKYIRTKAYSIAGPVVYSYPIARGQEEGFLAKGISVSVGYQNEIERSGMYRRFYNRRWRKWEMKSKWKELYDKHIVDNDERNFLIESLVRKNYGRDKYTIVLVTRLRHLKTLSDRFGDIPHRVVSGTFEGKSVKVKDRMKFKDKFEEGKVRLILANVVFSKGITIKRVDVVIDAAAGKNPDDALQKYGRGIGLHDDKIGLLHFDISDYDTQNEKNYFSRSAKARRKALQNAGVEVHKLRWQDETDTEGIVDRAERWLNQTGKNFS